MTVLKHTSKMVFIDKKYDIFILLLSTIRLLIIINKYWSENRLKYDLEKLLKIMFSKTSFFQ